MPRETSVDVVVDGNNVIGSVPDGWWRDKPAAARRLFDRLVCYRPHVEGRLVLVLDAVQGDLPEGEHDGIRVRYPRQAGRDAADHRIVELVAARGDPGEVEVVTSDQALADAVAALGASVVGSRNFLRRLTDLGC